MRALPPRRRVRFCLAGLLALLLVSLCGLLPPAVAAMAAQP